MALNIKLHYLFAARRIGDADLELAARAVVAHDVAFFLGDEPQHPRGALVSAGGVAVFAHVEVKDHGVVRVGDGGGVPPGVLGVEQQGVLRRAAERGVFSGGLSVQPAAELIAPLSVAVMLDGIGRGADAAGPPVGEVAVIDRRIGELVPDGGIELLQGDHAQLDFAAVAAVVLFNNAQDERLGRGVVAEHAGDGGDDEVVAVAVVLAEPEIVREVAVQRVHVVAGLLAQTEVALRHELRARVGADAEHVAEVVVLAVPHQQPLAGGVLPPVGVLVLIEWVHAVVAVDVGEEELDAMREQRVALAHGYAVDVGDHRRFHRHAVRAQQGFDLVQPAAEDAAVDQVAEV